MQKEYKLPSLSGIAKLKSGGIDNVEPLPVLKAIVIFLKTSYFYSMSSTVEKFKVLMPIVIYAPG